MELNFSTPFSQWDTCNRSLKSSFSIDTFIYPITLENISLVSERVASNLCDPLDYTVHGTLQARILKWVAIPFSRGSSQPRDQTQVSRIAGGFFTSWAIGKPKNTGVGSLFLLQRIFQTQELNQGLLHCRRILYQLSYEGSPITYG